MFAFSTKCRCDVRCQRSNIYVYGKRDLWEIYSLPVQWPKAALLAECRFMNHSFYRRPNVSNMIWRMKLLWLIAWNKQFLEKKTQHLKIPCKYCNFCNIFLGWGCAQFETALEVEPFASLGHRWCRIPSKSIQRAESSPIKCKGNRDHGNTIE